MNFDLEAIFGLLFVIFFVVVPIFSKRKKGGPPGQPGQPGGPGGPPQAPRGGPPVVSTGTERGAAASSSPPASAQPSQSPAGSLQATLDEIRKRVQEAQQQEQASGEAGRAATRPTHPASTSQQSATLSGSQAPMSADQFGSGMFSSPRSAPGSSQPPVGSQPGRTAAPRPATSAPLGREGRPRSAPLDSAAQLEVSKTQRAPRRSARHAPTGDVVPARRGEAASETKLSSALLGTTRADLVRGMIWHEILAEPVAHKRRRRIKSRPR